MPTVTEPRHRAIHRARRESERKVGRSEDVRTRSRRAPASPRRNRGPAIVPTRGRDTEGHGPEAGRKPCTGHFGWYLRTGQSRSGSPIRRGLTSQDRPLRRIRAGRVMAIRQPRKLYSWPRSRRAHFQVVFAPKAPFRISSLKKHGQNRRESGGKWRFMALFRGAKAPFLRAPSRLHPIATRTPARLCVHRERLPRAASGAPKRQWGAIFEGPGTKRHI